jgi:hypothetical protein
VEFAGERYHRAGKYVTGAGVSASLDTGLFLAQLIAGERAAKAVQLGIEYYPSPPFPERSPSAVPAEIQEIVRKFEGSWEKGLARLTPPFKDMFELSQTIEAGSMR